MKINFVCHELSGKGGIETVMVKVLNYLCQDNDVTLTLTNIPEQKKWLEELNPAIKIKVYTNSSKIEKILFFIKQFMFSDDDMCVVLGANLLKLASKIKGAFRKKYVLVSWIHFSLFEQEMFNPRNILYAEKHLAISSKIKSQLLSLGVNEEDISLIYNPVEKVNLKTYIEDNNNFRLLYIGRIMFDGQKNLKDLILGISKVCSEKKIVVDMYGTGKDLDKCQKYTEKLGVKDNFIWHGWKENPWEDIYFKPEALILTSKYEGLPMVMLEAETRGIPCITSKFEGYSDVIEDGKNGYSYEVGNIDQLVFNIEQISKNNIERKDCVNSVLPFFDENYLNNLKIVLSDFFRER